MENKIYDLVIIGAGPAGLSASIYASRYGIRHAVISVLPGGAISETHKIDNYPGLENLNGFEFSQRILKHAQKYQPDFIWEKAEKLEKTGKNFILITSQGQKIKCQAVLLATGTQRRRLNIAGEEKFSGKGVSCCATCDGPFFKNKTVAVIGGNDSAVGAADYLAAIAEKVYLIYRKSELRAEPYWVNLIKANKKIEIIYNTNPESIEGKNKVEKIKLDQSWQGKPEIPVDGVFVEIGADPDTELVANLGVKTDENGLIKVKNGNITNVAGLWAAGDITDSSDGFCQVITAAAEGAIAARSISKFLKNAAA